MKGISYSAMTASTVHRVRAGEGAAVTAAGAESCIGRIRENGKSAQLDTAVRLLRPQSAASHNYGFSGSCGNVSILTQSLGRLLTRCLPATCLLCGADAGNSPLCVKCAADLPGLPPARCPHCAEATTHGERCGRCLKEPPHFDATHAAFAYRFPIDRLIHALKYGHQLALAGWFGERLAEAVRKPAADCLVPLPLHPRRLQERGFNQSGEIAKRLACRLALPLGLDLLVRRRATPPQASLPLKERPGNVRSAFECPADLSGRHILLVDDVMTTGATLNEAARTLKLHGAARVDVAVVARAMR